ncbi:hypothetical protein PM082_016827 [Marasmius tenuissimus]|nr:hypothetical protein PM082_016827 [Marasmius tenuissimus]
MSAFPSITRIIQPPQFIAYTILYFGGEIELGGGVNSVMNGQVKVVGDASGCREDLVVRRHFVSGETGNSVLRLGIKSAYGVLSAWMAIIHDVDRVEPFWLRE